MNIKVAAFTVSEQSSNTLIYMGTEYDKYNKTTFDVVLTNPYQGD